MLFKKVGVVWNSKNLDKHGRFFMNGLIDEEILLHKAQKIFIFKTDPAKRGPKSPIATIVVGMEGEQYVPPIAPEPEDEPMPPPLPDTEDTPF
jgi:hypothetical protein